MNVIEYLKNIKNDFELFKSTFETELISYHINEPSWESSTTYIIMKKENVQNLEIALMISILQSFVRFGEFYFKGIEIKDIYKKCNDYLLEHYKEHKFELTNSVSLDNCINRISKVTEQRFYKNYNWNDLINIETLRELDWMKQNSIKSYKLKSEWNEEDYLFETKDYFIRFNWGTSA